MTTNQIEDCMKIAGEYLNPRYRLLFTIDDIKYVIDVETIINIPLRCMSTLFPLYKQYDKYRIDYNTYKVTINKYTSEKEKINKRKYRFVSFVEQKEFNSAEELIIYLNEWRDKADKLPHE